MVSRILRVVAAPYRRLIHDDLVMRLFIMGYFISTLLGFFLLAMPLCQIRGISWFDALFMATSAISTTGLVTIDVASTFTFFGQVMLLLLVQAGGIGYMLFTSFVGSRRLHREEKEVEQLRVLIILVFKYAMICEISGIAVLHFIFTSEGIDNPLWHAVFHSVSAFCTTGFSLFSANLENYKDHIGINITLSLLSLLGALGFLFFTGLFRRVKGEINLLRWVRTFAAVVIMMGTGLFLVLNQFPGGVSLPERIIASFFQTVSAVTTAGFNTVDMTTLSPAICLLLVLLMLFGVCLIGSGQDLRGTSFGSLLSLGRQALGPSDEVHLRRRHLLFKRMRIVTASFMHYLIVLALFMLPLMIVEKQPFLALLFESASALCTVGYSGGITAELSTFGQTLLLLMMLVGRIGIFSYGFARSLERGRDFASKRINAI